MARMHCPKGHWLWNGDGRSTVYALRRPSLEELMRRSPEARLGFEFALPAWEETLEGRVCERCRALSVFSEAFRYDYLPAEEPTDALAPEDWEELYVLKKGDLEVFEDAFYGKPLSEALAEYPFPYRARVSPDKRTILCFDKKGQRRLAYRLLRVEPWEPPTEPPPQPERIELSYRRETELLSPEGEVATSLEHTEQLTLDFLAGTLRYVTEDGWGARATHFYELDEGFTLFFEDLGEELLSYLPVVPEDILETPDELRSYELSVSLDNGERMSLSGDFYKDGLPVDYPAFAEAVSELMHTADGFELLSGDEYGRTRRRRSDLLFCKVRFEDYGQCYTYLSELYDLRPGDLVEVPVGRENRRAVARVVSLEYCQREDAPFPPEKTKYILQKAKSTERRL